VGAYIFRGAIEYYHFNGRAIFQKKRADLAFKRIGNEDREWQRENSYDE
jgi:hypothetical protein